MKVLLSLGISSQRKENKTWSCFDIFMSRRLLVGVRVVDLGGDCGAVGMLFDGGCGPD
jgi:hypothetical protein